MTASGEGGGHYGTGMEATGSRGGVGAIAEGDYEAITTSAQGVMDALVY